MTIDWNSFTPWASLAGMAGFEILERQREKMGAMPGEKTSKRVTRSPGA